MENPFQYGKVVSDPYFTDREEELKSLVQDVAAKHNVVLYSPRRFGKTSLLLKLANSMKDKGYNVLYLDFFRITSRAGFIELYAREIFKQSGKRWKPMLKKFASLVKGIRPVVSLDAMGVPSFSVSFETVEITQQTMESVLNLTENITPGKQWLVIFDEFQEITKLNGDGFENIMRAVIQHHQRSNYIFSGSSYHLLLEIFSRPGRAMYQFGKIMKLGKIPHEMMEEFIINRFAQTDVQISLELAREMVTRAGNIPNYVQYLAAELWQLALQSKHKPDINMLDKAVGGMLINLSDYFQQIMDSLSIHQKKVLVALSKDNVKVFSQEYHRTHHLGAISTTQRAVQKLVAEQLISPSDTGYEFGDPLFLLYLRSRINL